MKVRAHLRCLGAMAVLVGVGSSIALADDTVSPAAQPGGAAPSASAVVAAPAASPQSPPVATAVPLPQPTQGGSASSSPATTAVSAGNQPINPIPAASQPAFGTSPATPSSALPEPRIVSHPTGSNLNRIVLEHADNVHLDNDNVAVAEGHVKIDYREYTLVADKAVVNTETSVATFTGNVTVTSNASKLIVRTKDPMTAVVVDLKHGIYSVRGTVAAIIPPEDIVASGVLLPIYLNGGEITAKTDITDARDVGVTTCDFINPHYELVSAKVIVRPGRRLVARHVTVYRHGHRLFTLPLLVLPLEDRYQRSEYLPETGYSPDEGYFAKFAIPYALTAATLGLIHVDLMQLKGVGLGVDQGFTLGSHRGSTAGNAAPVGSQGGVLKLYTLKDRTLNLQTYTGSLTDFQHLPYKIDMHFDSQFANNSYFLSQTQSQTLNSNLALTRTVGKLATTLTTSLQQSEFNALPTDNLTSNLEQRLSFKNNAFADLRIGYTSNTAGSTGGAGGSYQKSLTTDFDFKGPTNHILQFELLTDTYTSLENEFGGVSGTANVGSVERLPEIRFTASPIGGVQNPILHVLPLMNFLTVSLGDFHDPSANARTERFLFNINTGPQSHKKKRIITSYLGQFEQDFYGDGAARYILNGTLGANYSVGDRSNFTVNYGTLRPYGFTPFFFDRTGTYNNASMNFTYEPVRKIQLVLGGGLDFTQTHSLDGLPPTPWQNLSIQLVAKPNSVLVNQFVTTFDPNHGTLFDISDNFNAGTPWGFVFQTGVRYSPSMHTFSTVTENLTLPFVTNKMQQAGYKLQALAGYNGFTKMLTYDGIQLTRSWHDFELSAVMQNDLSGTPGTTFYLNFTLKGFPGYQPFGIGQFGQGLDTSIGNVL